MPDVPYRFEPTNTIADIRERHTDLAPGQETGETVSVAGKTGTAQLDEGTPHSWFAGFAPYDGDRSKSIAFAVVVEHGGYGATTAGPVARQIVDAAAELGLVSVKQ